MAVVVAILSIVNLFNANSRIRYTWIQGLAKSRMWEKEDRQEPIFLNYKERNEKMIQSVQELPLILATNTSDITFSNDELRTRSATCQGWLNHNEGTAQYTILGNNNCNQSNVYKVTFNANVTSAETGQIEIGLKENGTPVVGASANSVVATANEYNNISFTKEIRLCPRENVTLTIGSVSAVSGVTPAVETVAPTIKNANLIIEKVRF